VTEYQNGGGRNTLLTGGEENAQIRDKWMLWVRQETSMWVGKEHSCLGRCGRGGWSKSKRAGVEAGSFVKKII